MMNSLANDRVSADTMQTCDRTLLASHIPNVFQRQSHLGELAPRIVAIPTGRTRTAAIVLVPEIDAAFRQIVQGEFERHSIACEDTNVMLAHFAGRVCTNNNAIVERDPILAIGKHLIDDSFEFQQFFFRQNDSLEGNGRSAPWHV
jgi:hypothetical protein